MPSLNALELNKPDRIELPSDSAKWLSPIEEKKHCSGENTATHGEYLEAEQGRTQEGKTRSTQEAQNDKAARPAGLRPRVEKEQGEKVGARSVEARLASRVFGGGSWARPRCIRRRGRIFYGPAHCWQHLNRERSSGEHSTFCHQVHRQADFRLGRGGPTINQNPGPAFPDRPGHRRRDWLGYLHCGGNRDRRTEVRHLFHPERTSPRLPDQAHSFAG